MAGSEAPAVADVAARATQTRPGRGQSEFLVRDRPRSKLPDQEFTLEREVRTVRRLQTLYSRTPRGLLQFPLRGLFCAAVRQSAWSRGSAAPGTVASRAYGVPRIGVMPRPAGSKPALEASPNRLGTRPGAIWTVACVLMLVPMSARAGGGCDAGECSDDSHCTVSCSCRPCKRGHQCDGDPEGSGADQLCTSREECGNFGRLATTWSISLQQIHQRYSEMEGVIRNSFVPG
eukprot:COSAG06_NODE_13039_length_1299_cov_8.049356_1_plen_232_part_00